jgi:hypothetical protein
MSGIQVASRALFDAILVVMPYLNGLMGLYIVGYLVQRLLRFPEIYNRPERIAMGCIAGGIVLATPALWVSDTPFDGWSFNVARFGILLYIVTGGIRRDRHAQRNADQVVAAERHLAERRAARER